MNAADCAAALAQSSCPDDLVVFAGFDEFKMVICIKQCSWLMVEHI